MDGEAGTLVRSSWRSLRRGLIELLFPGQCLGCGNELVGDGRAQHDVPFCGECRESLELFSGPTCPLCGVALTEASALRESTRGGCRDCDRRKLWFDQTIAAGRYTGRLRELVLQTKHPQGQALALALGRLLMERCGEKLAATRADVVVPVPMHWRRRLARGTNSAAILAEVVAGGLGAPRAEGLLRRRRNTMPQFECTTPQRWDNVRRAFSVAPAYRLNRAHVLLVDDIMTTGATCSEAAREFRRAGAERVSVVVVARSIAHEAPLLRPTDGGGRPGDDS